MHERHGVTRDADRRRGARLDPDHHGLVRDESPHASAEGLETLPQPPGNEVGHPPVEPRRCDAGDIGGTGQRRTGPPGHEIRNALCRSNLVIAPFTPGQLLELLLEAQPGQFAPLRTQVLEIRKTNLSDQPRIGKG